MVNGGETTVIVAVIKMMQLMKDKIVDHESFDVVIYCKQQMLIECFKDDSKWAQVLALCKTVNDGQQKQLD